jgi:hypothetical protein
MAPSHRTHTGSGDTEIHCGVGRSSVPNARPSFSDPAIHERVARAEPHDLETQRNHHTGSRLKLVVAQRHLSADKHRDTTAFGITMHAQWAPILIHCRWHGSGQRTTHMSPLPACHHSCSVINKRQHSSVRLVIRHDRKTRARRTNGQACATGHWLGGGDVGLM